MKLMLIDDHEKPVFTQQIRKSALTVPEMNVMQGRMVKAAEEANAVTDAELEKFRTNIIATCKRALAVDNFEMDDLVRCLQVDHDENSITFGVFLDEEETDHVIKVMVEILS